MSAFIHLSHRVFRSPRQMTVTMGNQLVECQECHNLYHQDCHKPQVTDKDVNDPRLVWYCARCTRQMKRMVGNGWMSDPLVRAPGMGTDGTTSVFSNLPQAQKPPQKPSPASAASAPVVKDPLVKKPEMKAKADTASTFQAFKRTEVKVRRAASEKMIRVCERPIFIASPSAYAFRPPPRQPTPPAVAPPAAG